MISSGQNTGMSLRLCVLIWPRPEMAEALHSYEAQVLPLLTEHHGRLIARERVQGATADDPAEIQIIEFDNDVALIKLGEKVTLEMELQVETTKADSSFNVIAEIPGTDLKDEIVMIGGHFDTWHAGTSATDNNSGVAACMEAARILKVLAERNGLKTRRTIRIGFWGGEEQGLFGSREYVSEFFAQREGDQGFGGPGGPGGTPEITKKAGFDKLSVYFNHDNGTGRLRGIYLQGNEATRPIFRRWLTAYGDPTIQTITIQNTGGTDHQSFDGVGLPGFQFIQDQIEYDSRTHHYNMDVYERLIGGDMKQAATVIAFFTWQAANRDGRFPRK